MSRAWKRAEVVEISVEYIHDHIASILMHECATRSDKITSLSRRKESEKSHVLMRIIR